MKTVTPFSSIPRHLAAGSALLAATLAMLIIPSPSQASFAVQVSAGAMHSCALLQSGHVKCWGDGRYGQLGVDGLEASTSAVEVKELSDAKQISGGANFNCALENGGDVACWGFGGQGQLGNGSTDNSARPVKVSGIHDALQIDGGSAHACALRQGGKISCWGSNAHGQLGDGTQTDSTVPVDGPAIDGVTQISAGTSDTCALAAGAVKCWGDNGYGKLGDGTQTSSLTPVDAIGVSDAVEVNAAEHFTCAVISDGTSKCWGYNDDGQLGIGDWVFNSDTPTVVSGITNAAQPTGGLWFGCLRLNDGTAACSGINTAGQLGIGEFSCYKCGISNKPLSVKNLSGVTSIASGNDHTCAATSDGNVKCWGDNWPGRLGNETQDASNAPVAVIGLPTAPTVAGIPEALPRHWALKPKFSGDPGDKLTCIVDDGAATDCETLTTIDEPAQGKHRVAVLATDSQGNVSTTVTVNWRIQRDPVVTGTAPELMKKNHRWYLDLIRSFRAADWDCGEEWRACAKEQLMTVQISTSSERPSDTQPRPATPSYANGVVAMTWWGTVGRRSVLPPKWVRVGTVAGAWTRWVAVSKLSKRSPQDTEPQDG